MRGFDLSSNRMTRRWGNGDRLADAAGSGNWAGMIRTRVMRFLMRLCVGFNSKTEIDGYRFNPIETRRQEGLPAIPGITSPNSNRPLPGDSADEELPRFGRRKLMGVNPAACTGGPEVPVLGRADPGLTRRPGLAKVVA
jgi:hypothetical protein